MKVNGLGATDAALTRHDPFASVFITLGDWFSNTFGPVGKITPPPVATPPVPITSAYHCLPPLVWDSYLAGCVTSEQVPSVSTQLSERTNEIQRAINSGYAVGSESAFYASQAGGISLELDKGKLDWPTILMIVGGSVVAIKVLGGKRRRR